MDADYILDVRGKPDPYPVAYTLHALQTLEPGQVLVVIADSTQTLHAFVQECASHGHRVLGKPRQEGSIAAIYFESAGLHSDCPVAC